MARRLQNVSVERSSGRAEEEREEMTVVVRTITRMLLPFTLVFGLYLVAYGHVSPGGGFQGGIVLVGAMMTLYIAFGYRAAHLYDEEQLDAAEHIGALGYLVTGLLGIAVGGLFLQNVLPLGTPGTLLSAGIMPVLSAVVGLKVASGTLLVILALLDALKRGE